MKPNSTTSKPQWPRLVSEFFVIVLGVLVALGVDSWASSSSDRRLEREYLGRLLEDVTYDLGELEFIRAVSASGLAYVDTLLSGRGLEFHGDRLVGSALIASNARVPDLSRNTFQELVASGRTGGRPAR